MIIKIIGQEAGGFDWLTWIILPALCCVMSMTMGQRGERPSSQRVESELWYTINNIKTTYEEIEKIVNEWHEGSKSETPPPSSFMDNIRNLLTGRREPGERFVTKEKDSPRLYVVSDPSGPIYFELTEVEDGGTVVKTTYNYDLKERMAKFKSGLPLRIPSTPIGLNCPTCGKDVLPDFELCPYCGEKLIKE
jgi:hypothetical protein